MITENKTWNWKTTAAIGAITVATSVGVCYYAFYRSKHKTTVCDFHDGIVTDCVENPYQIFLSMKDLGSLNFKKGKYADALDHYEKALKICPEDKIIERASLYQNMAVVYDYLNKCTDILPCLNKALILFPKYTKALNGRANCYEKDGLYAKALVDATAVAIFENFSTQDCLNRMESLVRKLAEKEVETTITMDHFTLQSPRSVSSFITSFPNDPLRDTELDLGDDADKSVTKCLELYRTDQFEDCFHQVRTLLSSDNDLPQETLLHMRLLRGTFYLLSCREVLALQDLNAVIDSALSEPSVVVNALIKKALAVMVSGDIRETRKSYSEAIRLDPQLADIYYHRGSFNQTLNLLDDAIRDFGRALELLPTYSIAAIQKAANEYERNKSLGPVSLDVFERLVEEFPQCPECHVIYAEILINENDLDKATQLCHKIMRVHPNSGGIYMTLAKIKLAQNDKQGAVEILQDSFEVDPKYGSTYHMLATLFYRDGDIQRAIELMDRSVLLATSRSQLRNLIAMREGMRAQLSVSTQYDIPCQEIFAKMARAVNKNDA